MVVPGDYLKLRLVYNVKDTGSPDVYVVDFTSTLGANAFTGPASVVDTYAYAERFVCTVRAECLDWLLIVGRRQLKHVLRTYTAH